MFCLRAELDAMTDLYRSGLAASLKSKSNPPPSPSLEPSFPDRPQNRKNRWQNCAREKWRRARSVELGHLPPTQAGEEAAVYPPLRPPLYHALRCERTRTARPEKDHVSRSAIDKILNRQDGNQV